MGSVAGYTIRLALFPEKLCVMLPLEIDKFLPEQESVNTTVLSSINPCVIFVKRYFYHWQYSNTIAHRKAHH